MKNRLRSFVAAPLAFLAVMLASAIADEVPGLGIAPYYHFSLDMKPIRIKLTHRFAPERSFPELVVSRAYAYFVDGAPQGRPLPNAVKSRVVTLAFVAGSGEAWTTAVEARALSGGRGREEAASALRSEFIDVQLEPSTNPDFTKDNRASLTTRTDVFSTREYEGMPRFKAKQTTRLYILGSGEDQFSTAQCYEPTQPGFFCTFLMQVTPELIAQIRFVDLHLHGGREFANRRLRFARETVCRFLNPPCT